MRSKMLLWIRRLAASAVLAAFVALFAFAPWSIAKYLAPFAKTQFWPSALAGSFVFVAITAVTVVFGRWYCGVMCPLGILQDLAFAFRRKRSQSPAGRRQWLVRLAFLVVFVALGAAGCGYAVLDPYGIFGRIFTTVSGAVLGAAVFALAVWKGRVWCNWVCPVGTMLGLLSRVLPTGLKIDSSKCIGCRKCERNCRASAISIEGKGGRIDSSKCVECRDCTAVCPKGAISFGIVPRQSRDAGVSEDSEQGMTRRSFIAGSTATFGAIAAEASGEKTVDGGYADVSWPGIDERNLPLKPAGSHSLENFRFKCVGCQLCVKECPNHVLRPSMRLRDFMQPEMVFDKGFCTEDCTRCSKVCPSGAMTPVAPEDKRNIHIGEAVWHEERCLAATEGVNCKACERHCPVGAIARVPNKDGVLIPVVDADKCIGCGACEHVCPVRPFSAMTVKAYERHREVWPMPEEAALDAASPRLAGRLSAGFCSM